MPGARAAHRGRGVREAALVVLGPLVLSSIAAAEPAPAAEPSAPSSASPPASASSPAPASSPTSPPETPPPAPASSQPAPAAPREEPIWRPDQYFYAEGFLITTHFFPTDPAAAAPDQERALLRGMWAWAVPLHVTASGLQLTGTSLVEASVLETHGSWQSFDQNRLCLGLAVTGRRFNVWNQVGRCYSPAKDPFAIEGPDPMVGFASVFWAYRTDNPFRQYGWRTDVNLEPGDTRLHLSAMLAVDDAALTDRGHERFALDRAIGAFVWRFPNDCRALGILNVGFETAANNYGGAHAECALWGAWEWGVGGLVGGPHNENGHGLQVLNRMSRTMPNGQTMELIGTATMSFLRWPGAHGQMYSLGGEGTWRFANGLGMTAGAFRVWLDHTALAEGGRRGMTETEAFMNVSWQTE